MASAVVTVEAAPAELVVARALDGGVRRDDPLLQRGHACHDLVHGAWGVRRQRLVQQRRVGVGLGLLPDLLRQTPRPVVGVVAGLGVRRDDLAGARVHDDRSAGLVVAQRPTDLLLHVDVDRQPHVVTRDGGRERRLPAKAVDLIGRAAMPPGVLDVERLSAGAAELCLQRALDAGPPDRVVQRVDARELLPVLRRDSVDVPQQVGRVVVERVDAIEARPDVHAW